MNFRDFVEQTRDGVEAVALGIRGDRDITPMVSLESEAGITVHGVEPTFFESSVSAQLLVERFVLPLIKQNEVRKVAWTYCAWVAPDEALRPSEHPDRREMLLATFIDPEVVEHWAAPIAHTLGRIVVGAWQRSVPNATTGPFITSIQEALR